MSAASVVWAGVEEEDELEGPTVASIISQSPAPQERAYSENMELHP